MDVDDPGIEALRDPLCGVGGAAVDDDDVGEAGEAVEAAVAVGLLVADGDGDRGGEREGQSSGDWVIEPLGPPRYPVLPLAG